MEDMKMDDSRKQKLIHRGAEALADALLQLAVNSVEVDDLIEQLIATPKEHVLRFKKKLSRLKQAKRFVDWRGTAGFVRELESMLVDVKIGVDDPLTGIELLADFYASDEAIFNKCDDSSGGIGFVFTHEAKELFVAFASRCQDKDKIVDIILKLNVRNDYGVRDALVDCAGAFLSKANIRAMISVLQKRADEENYEYLKRHHLYLIESLARQIKDADLFEKTRLASSGKQSYAAIIDVARVYLECGDVEKAHEWLKTIPDADTVHKYDRDQLLVDIYQKLGDREKLTDLLYQKFRSYFSTETLQALLDLIGLEKREEVVADAVAQIQGSRVLRDRDAEFLISIGKIDDADVYLLRHADQLDGNHYDRLVSFAKVMESEKRHLTASILYRRLLVSILERGYTKAYPYGIRYLKRLDILSASITDWQNFDPHDSFLAKIHQVHGRKRSFWLKYEVAK
jgi:hypothetical protein